MPTPDPGKLFPLPKQDNAPRICVTLQIPGDQESISNFVGALMRLALWNNYRRDDNKRAKNIAQVWKGIVRDIVFYDCNEPPGAGGGCEDGCEDMCCLRVFEGKLQSLQCGVWTTITGGDLSALAGPGVQQPAPGGAIESGDCKEFDVTLFGSNVYNLPVAVDAGYTIEITAATGGWSDGDVVGPFGAAWACPSGQAYALGTCGAAGVPDAGDPAPTLAHMRVVANVDGTWYDAYNTTITVPAGVSGAAVQFQANDAAIANNLGSITFHVKVCNVPAATFSHTFNFLIDEQGWMPWNDGGGARAFYSAGLGWDENPAYKKSRMSITFPAFSSRVFTGITIEQSEALSGNLHTTDVYYGTNAHSSSSVGPTIAVAGDAAPCTSIIIDIANDSDPNGTSVDGNMVSLTLTGMGSDPFAP